MRFIRAAVPLLISMATAPLFAQTPTAVVTGTVVDTSGATVPEARVAASTRKRT